MRTRLPTLLVVLAAALGPAYAARAIERPPDETAIQQFAGTDLTGRRWTVDDLRGRVVLIDFWATWCAPCLADLPRLKSLRERHSRAHFEILSVSLDVKSRQELVSWLNRNRIDWPQIHERAGYSAGLPRLFGVDRLPRTLIVGRDGRVIARDVRGDALVRLIEDQVRSMAPAPDGSALK